jgi:AhpD family alkylhydroperoxidase
LTNDDHVDVTEEDDMEARIKNPAMLVPGALQAILALGESAKQADIPEETLELVHLRVSQINGCSLCVDLHATHFAGPEGITAKEFGVAAWREMPYYDDAERAALALAECVTRQADSTDVVPDAVWAEAAAHYDDAQLASLLVHIATVNVFNRLNAATRQPAGSVAL